jgi:uncharacterized damage-inducible protein DinB
MKPRLPKTRSDLARAAVRVFAANERMNQLLLDHVAHLETALWTARPPGKVRTIAAIFTHMHNVRTKWIRLSAPHFKVPRQLGRTRCTVAQARAALAESAARCAEMLAEALDTASGAGSGRARAKSGNLARVTYFVRDGWAKPWPAGIEMLSYMLAHEAHHRGQISMLAHQLGFPLPGRITSELWNWERLWKERP